MRSHLRGVVVVAGAWLAPMLALAQPSPAALGLVWNDPQGLAPGSEAEFRARLSERLGRAAFDEAGSEHQFVVSWAGSSEECRVELRLQRGEHVEGTRSLKSPAGDCRSLGPALLTVAALLIESGADQTPPVESEPAPSSTAPTTSEQAPAERAPEPPRLQKDGPGALVSLGAQLASGFAPKLELGPALGLALSPWHPLRLGATGAFFVPHEYGARPGMQLGHQSIGVFACGMPLSGALGLGLCAQAHLHHWSAEGLSLAHPRSSHTYTWSLGAGARVEWQLVQRFWWVGTVGADLATAPLYFHYTTAPGGQAVLFRQQRLSPSLFLGLTMELW